MTDYFFDENVLGNTKFIESALKDSDEVQQEDGYICESVQGGLNSSAYDTGWRFSFTA